MKIELRCDWCGKEIQRYPSKMKIHNFCSRVCLWSYSSRDKNPDGYAELKDLTGVSKHMSALNRKLNPNRMTLETRVKLRRAHLGTGEGKHYAKLFSRPGHRIVAERMLGRPLRQGEVVHHIDSNKRNNRPENLMVFPSQKEHTAWHAKWKALCRKHWEEVMPDDVQTSSLPGVLHSQND